MGRALDDRTHESTRDGRRMHRLVAAAIALLAGVIAFWIGTTVYPHLSPNHDEAVYLQQATMLLEGQLRLYPPADLVADVRPWFFVRDGPSLYGKYSPVIPALWAVGIGVFGTPRVAVAAVAAGIVWLTSRLGSELFGTRVGLVAAVAMLSSPLFLLTGSTYLSYAPTTLANLGFAYSYVLSIRRTSPWWALLAGCSIGIAFFARPYTALLFAIPFVAHAIWTVWRDGLVTDGSPTETTRRLVATAIPGIVFVGLTLGYNAVLTGDPFVFPYAAFAPQDGIGFGHRQLLGYAIQYTPAVALQTNALVLWALLVRWGPAGVLGTFATGGGLLHWWRSRAPSDEPGVMETTNQSRASNGARRPLQAALAGLFVSVPLGNVYFWGNRNVLGALALPNDGFIAVLGPLYHFDLLAPMAIFAGVGVVSGVERLRAVGGEATHGHDAIRRIGDSTPTIALVVVLVGAGIATGVAIDDPVSRTQLHTERYERAYEPFEDRSLDHAVVSVPTPQGPWLNHPFQSLRNEPGFDGDVIYVQAPDSAADAFDVVDTYPDRRLFRYTYNGRYDPPGGDPIVPTLEPLAVLDGPTIGGEFELGVPPSVTVIRIHLAVGDGSRSLPIGNASAFEGVRWRANGSSIALEPVDGTDRRTSLSYDDASFVTIRATMVDRTGGSITYRIRFPLRSTGGGVQAILPARIRVCRLVTDCGFEGTYIEGHPGRYPRGVSVNETSAGGFER